MAQKITEQKNYSYEIYERIDFYQLPLEITNHSKHHLNLLSDGRWRHCPMTLQLISSLQVLIRLMDVQYEKSIFVEGIVLLGMQVINEIHHILILTKNI